MSEDRIVIRLALLPESIKALERGDFTYFTWITAEPGGVYMLHAHVPSDEHGEAYIRAAMDDDYGQEGPPSPEVEKLRDAYRERLGWK